MSKRRWFILLAVAALVAASLACGNGAEPEVREPDAVEEPAEEPVDEPAVGTTRGNPAPLGHEIDYLDMTIVLTEVTRPADDIAIEANMFNEPDEGYELVMVELEVTCNKEADDTCTFSPTNTAVIGSEGVAYDRAMVAGIGHTLDRTEFFGGATASGVIFYEVKLGDSDLVMRYEPMLARTAAFLALE